MRTGNNLLWVLLLATTMPSVAQTRYSRVSIQIPPQGLTWLTAKGVSFDHGEVNEESNSFITSLNTKQLAALKATGSSYSILIEDEEAAFRQQYRKGNFYRNAGATMVNGKLQFQQSCASAIESVDVPAAFTEGSYGGYYTFAEMQERINYMVNTYPSLVDTIILPTRTYNGNPLIVVKISDNADTDENEPEALYTGLHHAREGMSMMNLFFFMNYLLEHYNSDARIKDLVDSRELYFLPCVNPDGYVYNETNSPGGGGMWRKNRRNNGAGNGRGVDINRNYGVDWGVNGANVSISNDPDDETYIGPSAWSEPETRALRELGQSRQFTIAIDHHAYGNYYVTPFGRPALHSFTTQDLSFYKYASALMGKYNGYSVGDGQATVGYYAVGNSRDWHLIGDIGTGSKQKTYGYTVEIGSGSYGFWPDNSLIIPIARSMFFANLQMAYMSGSYFELQDLDPIAFNNTSGNYHFSIRRIGLTDAPVTVSLQALENITITGGPVSINSMPNYFDILERDIAWQLPNAIAPGTRIRFVCRTVSAGVTLTDTIVKFYQPDQLLNDDMESTTNWNYTGNWGTTTAAAFSGSRSLSESPSGNYSSNEQTYATYKNAIDLSDAESAYLVFRTRHRAQNGYDRLQVQLSGNGTSNYQSVCATGTIRENVGAMNNIPALTGIHETWTQEVVDLRDYLGNNNVRLRFGFMSNSSRVDEGFNIDNVEIVKSTHIVLSVQFIDVQAKRQTNGVLISWEANTGYDHHHFEVQRSLDGVNYVTIGAILDGAPYNFLDAEPGTENHYRIRAVDKKQRSQYSKTVYLNYKQTTFITVTPNPASHELMLRFNLDTDTRYLLSIRDVTGRQMLQQVLKLARGAGYRQFNISNWIPQLYIVTLKDLVTGRETVNKILKR
ncbi:M14 family zinc carboxypeptidase [Pseudoflavitalea rhizosphaerae]|uniref:M14 family zinc carboxypeptidase n=1 Tax=Pseudoflavitalea rhizosphaerae TaxID=1884793 RepID=UPI000F8C3DD7|nr:M14 family zinc carboxypeptidase [Pseudoflavitalea rhizosphaerae]